MRTLIRELRAIARMFGMRRLGNDQVFAVMIPRPMIPVAPTSVRAGLSNVGTIYILKI